MQAKSIMLQGTASGVGKSTLCIGLCRILARRGLRVAPFKAQNLCDQAHILPDGRHMARSQAIAAAACGVAPCPDMNPVLLMPGRQGCEVYVNGVRQPGFDVQFARDQVLQAYRRLQQRYDVIVVEGAGSPVELNLRQSDIVNMDFALRAGCPVVLVADIGRGGVFAMAYGTVSLLSAAERRLVRGLVVNDFHGSPASFAQGSQMLADLTGVPVLGVVPHLQLHLEDEDSLPARVQTRESITALLPPGVSFAQYQQTQFDHLADALADALDLAQIERILQEGVPHE